MKKYDKIFVPDDNGDFIVKEIGGDDEDRIGWFGPVGDVIILSIEELRDLWNHCANCQVDKETEYANSINFNAYLTSKGIQL